MKKNSLSKWIILLQSILVVIFAVIIGGCAETNQNNTVTTPQPELGDNDTFTIPQPVGENIYKFITPQEAFTLIQENQDNPDFVIIDDRPPAEFKSGHIAGAINIQAGPNFSAGVSRLDKNKIYLLYCRTGCGEGSSRMNSLGFKEVYDIEGGLNAWKSEGLPIVK